MKSSQSKAFSAGLGVERSIGVHAEETKAGSDGCKLKAKTREDPTGSVAAAKEISVDGMFTFKEEQRAARKFFLGGKDVFPSLLTIFGADV